MEGGDENGKANQVLEELEANIFWKKFSEFCCYLTTSNKPLLKENNEIFKNAFLATCFFPLLCPLGA